MMTTFSKTRLLALGLVFLALESFAQDLSAFASFLVRSEDYFRAVTVYKELGFFASDPQTRSRARIGEGLAYLLSGKSDLALGPLAAEAQNDPEGTARFLMGLCYLRQRNLAQAESVWGQEALPKASLEAARQAFRALFQLSLDRTATAREILAAIPPGTLWDDAVLQGKLIVEQLDTQPRFSPWVAGGASLLIPGLGQVATGHFVDGFQAFFSVGLLGAATYGVYLYDSKYSSHFLNTGIGLVITASFHLANVLGAAKTAGYANQAARNRILTPWEKGLWSRLVSEVLGPP